MFSPNLYKLFEDSHTCVLLIKSFKFVFFFYCVHLQLIVKICKNK